MPRGRVRFNTTGSPRDPEWPGDPEGAIRAIARRNSATYIDGSLVFAPNGRHAEALFETVEPEPGSPVTKLHQLGIDLDASEVTLFVDRERWQFDHPELSNPELSDPDSPSA